MSWDKNRYAENAIMKALNVLKKFWPLLWMALGICLFDTEKDFF